MRFQELLRREALAAAALTTPTEQPAASKPGVDPIAKPGRDRTGETSAQHGRNYEPLL